MNETHESGSASQATATGAAPLLEVRGLTVTFATEGGRTIAVDGLDLDVHEGETLGVVGESGCGKTVTALAIMRLVQSPGRIDGGEILYRGRNLLELSEKEMRSIRGNEISMVFQEPMTSLNPVFTCGYQVEEAILLHEKVGKRAARERALEMLSLVRIPDPARVARAYPHQLSGGMRQRVMIAMALACHPRLLIADEPTTALDVTIQAQILELLRFLQEQLGMAILMITHDLGVIAETARRVMVMYSGQVVEAGTVEQVFGDARHPYTMGLRESIPRPELRGRRLSAIPGMVPERTLWTPGCRFSERCRFAEYRCDNQPAEMRDLGDGHRVRCWKDIDDA